MNASECRGSALFFEFNSAPENIQHNIYTFPKHLSRTCLDFDFSLLIMMLSTFICIYIENMRKQVDYIQVKLLRMVNIFANYIYFPPTPILWATFV